MPRATSLEETERHELQSLPEGFVVLRRLTYGEKIKRRGLSTLSMTAEKGKKNLEAQMQLANEAASAFDFAHCIVDHNLEDETGRKLNLGNKTDLLRLDPRVGDEIEQLMDELNNFEAGDAEGN